MKKKILAILMAAVIVLTFGACGSSPASSSGSSGQYGNEEILSFLQNTHVTQRNEVRDRFVQRK